MAWAAPRDWTTGELVTAAIMNAHVRDQLSYLFDHRNPTGAVQAFAMATAPSGWLACDGSAVSQATYDDLFTAIGTTWNTGGEGAGNFRLPDFRGRALIGSGTGTGLTARTVGDTLGVETHQLTVDEMPSHTHELLGQNYADGSDAGVEAGGTGATTGSTGGDQAHENMPPSAVILWCIKT